MPNKHAVRLINSNYHASKKRENRVPLKILNDSKNFLNKSESFDIIKCPLFHKPVVYCSYFEAALATLWFCDLPLYKELNLDFYLTKQKQN